MATLRLRFIERAREEREAIEAAAGTPLVRETLRRRAHSIAGTAGLFGFHETGERASRLEDALDEEASDEDVRALAAALNDSLSGLV